jgi:hypothetical protein
LTKNRSLEQTRRGQEIVAEKGSVDDNSTSRYVKELFSLRLETLGKKYLFGLETKIKNSNKKRAIEKIKKEVDSAKKQIEDFKRIDIKEAQSIIDRLTCK